MTWQRIVFDIETNGFADVCDTVHCMVLHDLDSGETRRYTSKDLAEGLSLLEGAQMLVGHNIQGFDLPVLRRLHSLFTAAVVRDTQVLSRLCWPDIKALDAIRMKKGKWVSNKNVGRHSLESWGERLGAEKDDYIGWCKAHNIGNPFATFRQEMLEYCERDVQVNVKLWGVIEERLGSFSEQSVELEHEFALRIREMIDYGWAVDVELIEQLYATMSKRNYRIAQELEAIFTPVMVADGKVFYPKRDNAKQGYVAGAPLTKVKVQAFNPGSRLQVAARLKRKYGWSPKQFTPTGEPQIDEAVLLGLPYAEAKLLAEYYANSKRMGMLADGNQSWLKHHRNGRIHPVVIHNGAVTGRCAHHSPAVAQVPRVGSAYGEEMRSCWRASEGKVMVGCDAEGIEMRALSHYMYRYDGGEYVNAVISGDKADGTDPHSLNAKAMELESFGVPANLCRDAGKTIFYALIYGAGDYKLGAIALKYAGARATRQKCAVTGKQLRAKLNRNLPALMRVVNAVQTVVRKRGWLVGIDGRRLDIRSAHSAFNMLLQSFGAIVMKKATVLLHERLESDGLVSGRDFALVGHIHDELQLDVAPVWAELVGQRAAEAIATAGIALGSNCPLAGEYRVGKTWAETH